MSQTRVGLYCSSLACNDARSIHKLDCIAATARIKEGRLYFSLSSAATLTRARAHCCLRFAPSEVRDQHSTE